MKRKQEGREEKKRKKEKIEKRTKRRTEIRTFCCEFLRERLVQLRESVAKGHSGWHGNQ